MQTLLKIAALGGTLFVLTNPLMAEDMSSFDDCLAANGAEAIDDCLGTRQNLGTVNQSFDSTDQGAGSASYRFAGAGLNSVRIGGPDYEGSGEFRYEMNSLNLPCIRYEKTILRATYRREDGVIFTQTELDADGNPITGSEIYNGNVCQTSADWSGVSHSRYTNTNKASSGGPCGRDAVQYHYYYLSAGDEDRWAKGTVYGNRHCATTTSTATITVKKEGELVAGPITKTCQARASSAAVTAFTDPDGTKPRWNTSGPGYPAMDTAQKNNCLSSWGF